MSGEKTRKKREVTNGKRMRKSLPEGANTSGSKHCGSFSAFFFFCRYQPHENLSVGAGASGTRARSHSERQPRRLPETQRRPFIPLKLAPSNGVKKAESGAPLGELRRCGGGQVAHLDSKERELFSKKINNLKPEGSSVATTDTFGLNPAQQRDSGAKGRCAESERRRAINSAQTRTWEEKSCPPGFTKAAGSCRNAIKNKRENFLRQGSWSRYPGVRGGDLLMPK